MGILQKAVDEIKYRIPYDILNAAFRDYSESGWRGAPVSLEELIMSKVIRPRVIFDTNIVGGETIMVPLDGLMPKYADHYTRVVEIPLERVNGRSIMSVLSAHYLPHGYSFNNMNSPMAIAGYGSVNDVTSTANKINTSFANVPPLSSAMVQLTGPNVVLIRDRTYITNVYSVRCVVANEENLENINPRSWHVFAKLCELATKSYVYNKLVIQMDSTYLQGGQSLGVLKDIVDEYRECHDLYDVELREKWQKVNFLNDTESTTRFYRLMVNPAL